MDDLMTSGEVATALGVGASTVKRWTDTGELTCVKTLGKHRRFAKAEVEAFAKRLAEGRVSRVDEPLPSPAPAKLGRDADWLRLLVAPGPAYVVQAALLSERAKLGSWHQVAAHMGAVVDSLAAAAAAKQIVATQEHLASERLLRGLILVNESLTVRDNAPVCLLATAEGDDSTVGLALLELTLRETGWQPHWLGPRMPASAIASYVAAHHVGLVALSASAASDAEKLTHEAQIVGDACKSPKIELVLAGHGAWPDPPPYGQRIRTFTSFFTLLTHAKG